MKSQALVFTVVSMIAAVSAPARAEELRGVLNFYELNPSVSRGAQPTDASRTPERKDGEF